MITNDVQYRSTKAHLRQFEEALANLKAQAGKKPTKLQQLEIDAVTAQADDLRAESPSTNTCPPARCRPSKLPRSRAGHVADPGPHRTSVGRSDDWPTSSASPSSRCSATSPPSTARPASPASATSPRRSASTSPRRPTCVTHAA